VQRQAEVLHPLQAATAPEFANCFVSTVYTLKGRKITTRILNNGENG